MSSQSKIQTLRERLRAHAHALTTVQQDIAAYQELLQERHDQLTHRVERLETKVDGITNPETPRSVKLMDEYERLSDAHAQSEEVLDELENVVLEPLWEAQQTLHQLVS